MWHRRVFHWLFSLLWRTSAVYHIRALTIWQNLFCVPFPRTIRHSEGTKAYWTFFGFMLAPFSGDLILIQPITSESSRVSVVSQAEQTVTLSYTAATLSFRLKSPSYLTNKHERILSCTSACRTSDQTNIQRGVNVRRWRQFADQRAKWLIKPSDNHVRQLLWYPNVTCTFELFIRLWDCAVFSPLLLLHIVHTTALWCSMFTAHSLSFQIRQKPWCPFFIPVIVPWWKAVHWYITTRCWYIINTWF